MPGHTAKFHLDRLVDDGLLDVEFRRLSGKTGPGAGRPAKLYRRSRRQIALSLPQRSYDLLSTILARGVEEAVAEGTSVGDVTARVAREEGQQLGAAAAREVPEGDELRRLAWSLQPHGYEPRIEDGRMVLENCPFDKVARDHTDLVCGLNLEFVGGVADGLGCAGLAVSLEPSPGRCCVSARREADPPVPGATGAPLQGEGEHRDQVPAGDALAHLGVATSPVEGEGRDVGRIQVHLEGEQGPATGRLQLVVHR